MSNRGLLRGFLTGIFSLGVVALAGVFVQQAPPRLAGKRPLHFALVQTGLFPEEKLPIHANRGHFIPLLHQWGRIFEMLKSELVKAPDYIILPECVVPYPAQERIYPFQEADALLTAIFGKGIQSAYPEPRSLHVSNAFFLEVLANYFQAEVFAGMEESDGMDAAQSAFYFSPLKKGIAGRYDKQKLVPGEYLPAEIFRSLAAKQGIYSFFQPGKEAKVLGGKTLFSPSICYDEVFPEIVRAGRLLGADILLNMTNDNWYPHSKLPEQHYYHAKLRAVENGAPLIRVCNSGITAAVDCRGEEIARFGKENKNFEFTSGVLQFSMIPETRSTLYLIWGDGLIIGLSLLLIGYKRRIN